MRTTLQAIQEQTPRGPNNLGYPAQQMDPYQDANVTHQQLNFMASNESEDQLTRAAMQISPVHSANASVSSQPEDSQSQPQGQQALEDAHDASPDEEFIESDYLHDEPTHEGDLCDEGVSPVTRVEVQMSGVRVPIRSSENTVQLTQDDDVSASSDSESEDIQERSIRLEDNASLEAVSLAMATRAVVPDQQMPHEAVNGPQAGNPAGLESPTEESSLINDRNRASDLIKALEQQGALAELLEELGYQKPRESDDRDRPVQLVSSVVSDGIQVVCDEPNCGKVFPRPCELK
ncbi:hypothetical protein Daus18300_006269 [Diaporthe australafricana]|uniref:Uncharacterized protein n=1 Tax=Diaporthe australafricana TaxID=127596 RepID=A0ABR3WVU2_9PEZI